MKFNRSGYLTPATAIPATLEEIETRLVQELPDSSTRSYLYTKLRDFLREIKLLVPGERIEYWIDGSFATLKTNPNDVDIVTFVDYRSFNNHLQSLKTYAENYRTLKLPIDAYFVADYPEDHRLYSRSQADRAYWVLMFSSTKASYRRKASPKEFIKLIIDHG